MNWLVQDCESLALAAKMAGHKVVEIEKFSFVNTDDIDGMFECPYDPTFCYGSIQLCNRFLNKSKKLYPGVIATSSNYKCSSYYPFYGNFLCNNDYMMIPYGELIRMENIIFKAFGVDNCIFIRPNSGLKEFTGQVVDRVFYKRDIKNIGFYDVLPNEICVISSPKVVIDEYRFVVYNNTVITGSSYRLYKLHKEKECFKNSKAWKFAQEVVDAVRYSPDPVYVLDISFDGEKFSVMEIGAISYAGLYDCNKDKIVEVIEQVCKDEL